MPKLWRSGWSVVAVSFLFGCASQPPPRSLEDGLLGDVMPSFESRTLNGNQLFSGAFQGRPMVVSFVGSECDGCSATLEAAQAMYSDASDVVVVGVFPPDDSDTALTAVKRLEIRFPVVVDEDDLIAKSFNVERRPTTFVADEYGRVKWVAGSTLTEDGLTSAVRSVN